MFNSKMLRFAICLGILMSTTVSSFPSEPPSSALPHNDDNKLVPESSNQSENKLVHPDAFKSNEHALEPGTHQEASELPHNSNESAHPAAPDSDQNQKQTDDPKSDELDKEKERTFIREAIDRTRKFLDKLDLVLADFGFSPFESRKHLNEYQVALLTKPISSCREYAADDRDILEWENLVEQIVGRVEDATIQFDEDLP